MPKYEKYSMANIMQLSEQLSYEIHWKNRWTKLRNNDDRFTLNGTIFTKTKFLCNTRVTLLKRHKDKDRYNRCENVHVV